MPQAIKSLVIQFMPPSRVAFIRSKSDRDGYGIIGTKYKQMDRWMSECSVEEEYGSILIVKELRIWNDVFD